MRNFLRVCAYLFNPLSLPLFGVCLYFCITPFKPTITTLGTILGPLVIFTLLIPILLHVLLQNFGVKLLGSLTVKQSYTPIILMLLLYYLLALKVFTKLDMTALYYYLISITIALLSALGLLIAKFKVNLSIMGMANLVCFVIGISIHYQYNILGLLSFLIICSGLVASAKIKNQQSNFADLIIGIIIGALSQITLFEHWV